QVRRSAAGRWPVPPGSPPVPHGSPPVPHGSPPVPSGSRPVLRATPRPTPARPTTQPEGSPPTRQAPRTRDRAHRQAHTDTTNTRSARASIKDQHGVSHTILDESPAGPTHVTSYRPPKFERRNGADSSSLACVLGKAWVAS